MKRCIFVLLLLLLSCKREAEDTKPRMSVSPIVGRNESEEIFSNFYTSFFEDSSFQVSRIKFPLVNVKVSGRTDTLSAHKWRIMKIYSDINPKNLPINYTYKISLTDSFYVESFFDRSLEDSNGLTFQRLDGKWHLVRCSLHY